MPIKLHLAFYPNYVHKLFNSSLYYFFFWYLVEEGTLKSNLVQLCKRVTTHTAERSFVEKKKKIWPEFFFKFKHFKRLFTFYSLFNPITFLLTHWNIVSKHEHFNEDHKQPKEGVVLSENGAHHRKLGLGLEEPKNCVGKEMTSYWKSVSEKEKGEQEKSFTFIRNFA